MRIALGLPTGMAAGSGEVVLEWVARAEAGPFAAIAVLDRVVMRGYEPLAVLAAAAGATRRLDLIASVVIGPARETTLLARQAATIDALASGRLVLGLGIGIREDDYLATGQAFRLRGRRLDEQLPVLRRLWAGEPLSEAVGPIGLSGPGTGGRPGGPRLLLGGYTPRLAARIAAFADGYMAPGGGEPELILERWGEITAAWRAAGRSGEPDWIGSGYFALGPDADARAAAYIEAQYGRTPELAARRLRGIPTTETGVRAFVERQAAMGARTLILRPITAELDQADRLAAVLG